MWLKYKIVTIAMSQKERASWSVLMDYLSWNAKLYPLGSLSRAFYAIGWYSFMHRRILSWNTPLSFFCIYHTHTWNNSSSNNYHSNSYHNSSNNTRLHKKIPLHKRNQALVQVDGKRCVKACLPKTVRWQWTTIQPIPTHHVHYSKAVNVWLWWRTESSVRFHLCYGRLGHHVHIWNGRLSLLVKRHKADFTYLVSRSFTRCWTPWQGASRRLQVYLTQGQKEAWACRRTIIHEWRHSTS